MEDGSHEKGRRPDREVAPLEVQDGVDVVANRLHGAQDAHPLRMLKRGLAAVRNGSPAVIGVWLPTLIEESKLAQESKRN